MTAWPEALQAAQARGVPFVMVTVTAIRGSAPGELGARAFVDAQGLVAGTVGGGKLEARAIAHAQAMLMAPPAAAAAPHAARPRTEAVTWNLTRDIEMTCGGEVSLLFEPLGQARMAIALFGAGHVAQALVRALLPLDCQIKVFDARAEWLARLPMHARVVPHQTDDLVAAVAACGAGDMFVVMTRGHATDLPVLQAIYARRPAAGYVGCMGSAVKAARLRRELAEAGVAPAALARFCCPIGLALGSNAPEEIAISVVAELLQRRDEAPARDASLL